MRRERLPWSTKIPGALAWFVAGLLVSPMACRSSGEPVRALGTAAPLGPVAAAAPPTFLENDYEGALGEAKRRELPLFVDAWAPWCHSCISMKAFVLKDPALASQTPRFGWASIDTEHESSKAFVEKFPMDVWPTLWVVDSRTERPLLKWPGAATALDLIALLEATMETRKSTDEASRQAWDAWQAGNQHLASGERDLGITAYQRALSLAPVGFSVRPQLVEALVFQLGRARRASECVDLAAREFAALPKGTSRLQVVLSGLGCSNQLEGLATSGVEDARRTLVAEADRQTRDPSEPVLADDRSSMFQELEHQYSRLGETAHARATAERWSEFLEGEARDAPMPKSRVVFDYHRWLAYEALGEPERAIPMLERSERDFPDDYDAPSRLARVYADLGRLDQALAASERAAARVYGPRTLRVLKQQAEILQAMNRRERALHTLERAIAFGERAKPLPSGYQRLLDDLKERRSTLQESKP